MLYSVTGGQGSGKSTVLKELEQRYGFKVVQRKTSRSILSDWNVSLDEVNNNHDLTVSFQEEILKRKWEDEKEARESSEIWLTERTYLDLFVYALVALGKDNRWSNWLDQYYDRCFKNQLDGYDNIFYLPVGFFKPVDDGVRAINQHYQQLVDRTLYSYLQQIPNVHTIDVMNLSDRINKILTVINK